MRLFGRKGDVEDDGIATFWAWWEGARPRIDALVAADDTAGLAAELGPAVRAVHPDLVWELAPGREAAHALVVTAAGDAELRPLAHRWARAAPTGDLLWEFHPSRQANARAQELTVEAGGVEVPVGKLVLGLRAPLGATRVDVAAYHPVFGELGEDDRMEAALLALDRVLGEDEVARWVGEIRTVTHEPIDGVAAVHLPAVVADLASGYTEEQWALLEGLTASGAPLVATVRHPLRPVDFPLFEQHVMVTLPYAHRDDDGLPAGESVEALGAFDERLAGLLAEPAAAAVLAVHLSAEGHRIVHVYADPDGDAAERLRELAAGWREGRARVDVADDPAWSAVVPFVS